MKFLSLDHAELERAFDTKSYADARISQYGAGQQSSLAMAVLDKSYILRDDEVADLLMDGPSLWNFINTLVEEVSDRVTEETGEALLHNLGNLPEGPFFYAVRAMYCTSEKLREAAILRRDFNPSMPHVADVIDQFIYYSQEKETPSLRVADDRLKGLGRLVLSNSGEYTIAPIENAPGCALIEPVCEVFKSGKVPTPQAGSALSMT